MTEHVLGAEFAARLVQRARDGMAFALCPCCWHGWEWRTTTMPWCGDIAAGTHWADWYRETLASRALADWVHETPPWQRTGIQIRDMLFDFEEAVCALGSLCPSPLDLRHYPTEWTV